MNQYMYKNFGVTGDRWSVWCLFQTMYPQDKVVLKRIATTN